MCVSLFSLKNGYDGEKKGKIVVTIKDKILLN